MNRPGIGWFYCIAIIILLGCSNPKQEAESTAEVRPDFVGVLHLPPLHMTFPASWRLEKGKYPIELRGPKRLKVLVSVFRRPEPIEKSGKLVHPKSMIDFANELASSSMLKTAEGAFSTVIRPVSPFGTPEGKIGFSSVSSVSGLLGRGYFFQYVLASPSALYFFTFEGSGDAAPKMEFYDRLMSNQEWDD